MILKSQSMRFVMATMMDVEHEWQTSKWIRIQNDH